MEDYDAGIIKGEENNSKFAVKTYEKSQQPNVKIVEESALCEDNEKEEVNSLNVRNERKEDQNEIDTVISNINHSDENFDSLKGANGEESKKSASNVNEICMPLLFDEPKIISCHDSPKKSKQLDEIEGPPRGSLKLYKNIPEIFVNSKAQANEIDVLLDRSFLTESCSMNETEEEKQGLWFKDDIAPSDLPCIHNRSNKEEYDKILSYEHQFVVPTITEPLNKTLDKKLVHNDFSFDETDFRFRRSLSVNQSDHINIKKKKRKHESKKKQIIEEDEIFNEEKTKKDNEKVQKYHKKIGNKVLESKTSIKESKELSKENTKDKTPSSVKFNQKIHGKKQHHKKHYHARHQQNKAVNSQYTTLESRIRSGIQTLKEEHRAIQELTSDIKKEFREEDVDDIYSHRFGHFAGIRRHSYRKRTSKSGMTTHIRMESFDNTKEVLNKPHVHITMVDDELNLSPREGFVELEELTATDNNELQWKERARWLKFEEDIEKNERWGKPHVASLSFQSLLEMRRGVERGTVLLNLENYDLPSIFESVVDNMIITDQLHHSMRDKLIAILLSKHCHHHQRVGGLLNHKNSVRSIASDLVIKNDLNDDQSDQTEMVEDEVVHIGSLDGIYEKERLKAKQSTDSYGFRSKKSISFKRQHSAPVLGNRIVKSKSNAGDDGFLRLPSLKFRPVLENSDESKKESDIKSKIPDGAEASSVLVATIDDLDRPAMAFVRLSKGCMLGNLSEVNIPIRFLFLILGPPSMLDYYEIGRSIATLMSDKIFHDLVYAAKNRDDILDAINSFLEDSIVLAPGDWDRHLLLPLLQAEITEKKKQRIKLLREKVTFQHPDENLFLRTSNWFGGLKCDLKKKAKFYQSDFVDGLNFRCLVTIIFVFFATLAPTITFGALLSKKTDDNLGVMETLIATALCGIIFSFFAGQPLIIIGATGPILVFEQATYMLCQYFQIDFLVWRLYIGLMVMVILWVIVALEGCFLVEYFTRFTEEVFSVLISLLFIYEALSFVIQTFSDNHYHVTTNVSANYSNANFISTKIRCNQGDIGLISSLLIIGTLFVSQKLRQLRNSHFFSSNSRRVLSDFGVPIAMILMVVLNIFSHDVEIPKIKMSKFIRPTSKNRTVFFVNPLGANIKVGWVAFAIIPAICVSILLFMETELTGVLLNKRKNKLRKSGGYNLDIFVMGALTGLCSVLGLPWMCAGSVMSVQHQNALAILSRTHAPGEKPYLVQIKEQRLTNLCIHVIIGCCIFAESLISMIPLAVCFGVFMYLGIASLSGIQFIEQIKLIFVPMKYHPNKKYVRSVKFRSLVTYTLIQVFCLCVLIGIKLSPVAPLFPFAIMFMVFLRRFIGRFYTDEELEELDNEDDHEEFEDFDEYGTSLSM